MKFLPLILLIIPILIEAKKVDSKVMHAQDRRAPDSYSRSSNHRDRGDEILCSTTEASGQIIFMIAVQATSEITSGEHPHSSARLSYLDNNRVEITEDIAKGEGEHLETLLSMIKPDYNKKSLITIQENFDKLIYLNHNEFLDKIESLV